jgi:ribonuclease-3
MMDRLQVVRAVEGLLGHHFEHPELLEEALRHGSASRSGVACSYERLEFLGDAVLGHAVAQILLTEFPDADQGELTRIRSHLTRSATLAQKASLLGFDQYIELGASEEMAHGRERSALLEDVFEAVIGALVLDGGWEPAFSFIQAEFRDELDELDEKTLMLADPKTALQEAAQARGLPLPRYLQVGSTGPDHKPRWAFAVEWDGEEVARAEGRNKRDAQKRAARRALVRLGLIEEKR